MPVTANSIEAFLKDRRSRVSPQEEQPGARSQAAFQPAAEREEVDSSSIFNQEEFPLTAAFGQGLAESLSLGIIDAPEREMWSAEGVAQIAGEIVGEIPFWVVGGGLTKMLLVRGAKSLQTAAAAGGAFGKAAKLTMAHGVAAGEAATAVGVDVGRAFIGDEEGMLSPSRMAINVSVPFAQSLFRIAKTRGTRQAERDSEELGRKAVQEEYREYEEFLRNEAAIKYSMLPSPTKGKRKFQPSSGGPAIKQQLKIVRGKG